MLSDVPSLLFVCPALEFWSPLLAEDWLDEGIEPCRPPLLFELDALWVPAGTDELAPLLPWDWLELELGLLLELGLELWLLLWLELGELLDDELVEGILGDDWLLELDEEGIDGELAELL